VCVCRGPGGAGGVGAPGEAGPPVLHQHGHTHGRTHRRPGGRGRGQPHHQHFTPSTGNILHHSMFTV